MYNWPRFCSWPCHLTSPESVGWSASTFQSLVSVFISIRHGILSRYVFCSLVGDWIVLSCLSLKKREREKEREREREKREGKRAPHSHTDQKGEERKGKTRGIFEGFHPPFFRLKTLLDAF